MLVNKGDVITFKERSKNNENIKAMIEAHRNKTVPSWLTVDYDKMTINVVSLPRREDVTIPVEEHLIVELYSK